MDDRTLADSIIPEAAVEAAVREYLKGPGGGIGQIMRAALAAALPHIPRLAAAQARIAELEEALGLFAKEVGTGSGSDKVGWVSFHMRDLRRAREVLERKAPFHPARGTE